MDGSKEEVFPIASNWLKSGHVIVKLPSVTTRAFAVDTNTVSGLLLLE